MATFADYVVLQPGTIELGFGTNDYVQNFDFKLPDDYRRGTDVARPLLAYIVKASGKTSVGVYVNPSGRTNVPPGTSVFDLTDATFWNTWSGGGPQFDRALWDAIDGRLLNAGSNNTIYFRVVEGNIHLRDVVLWFQRGTAG